MKNLKLLSMGILMCLTPIVYSMDYTRLMADANKACEEDTTYWAQLAPAVTARVTAVRNRIAEKDKVNAEQVRSINTLRESISQLEGTLRESCEAVSLLNANALEKDRRHAELAVERDRLNDLVSKLGESVQSLLRVRESAKSAGLAVSEQMDALERG